MAHKPNPHIAESMQENIGIDACQNISLCVQAVGPERKDKRLDATYPEESASANNGHEGIGITLGPNELDDVTLARKGASVFVKIET